MVLGDPEGPGREAMHPGDATFRGFGALGGDYRGGYLTRVIGPVDNFAVDLRFRG